jgi:hypothetical protein
MIAMLGANAYQVPLANETVRCPDCGGLGIQIVCTGLRPEYGNLEQESCDRCGGTGKIVVMKVLCTGHPACGFPDCPHATAHDPYTFGGSDGETCEDEGPCEQWQQIAGVGVKGSMCRCVKV